MAKEQKVTVDVAEELLNFMKEESEKQEKRELKEDLTAPAKRAILDIVEECASDIAARIITMDPMDKDYMKYLEVVDKLAGIVRFW